MSKFTCIKVSLLAGLGAIIGLSWAQPAVALPSFARQTNQACVACHVGSFGPQLTAFGREFKLRGYTLSAGEIKNFPLSAMMVASETHTKKDQPADAGPHDGVNNNFSVQELSGFIAGRLSEHVGIFAQATYSDINRKVALDNVEVRYAKAFTKGEHSGVYGVSVNNNPGLSDVWHNGAWRFPFTGTELSPVPEVAPLIDGGLGQQVIGADAYVSIDSKWYASLGLYKTLSPAILADINADYGGRLENAAPYWRLTYTTAFAGGGLTLGAAGLHARIQPDSGFSLINQYDDFGVDASYEKAVGSGNQFTMNANFMHERQALDAAFAFGEADSIHHSLNTTQINAAYYWAETYGLTLGWFGTTGTRDTLLYADSINFSPVSHGEVLQADWTPFGKSDSWKQPWMNVRFGLQYTHYNQFEGASRNYDGTGRNASDNDALFAFAWFSL